MTGQGHGRIQFGSSEVTAEIRSVNNRHLKLNTRTGDGLGPLEPQIETLVRSRLRRGSVQLNIRVYGDHSACQFEVDYSVVEKYILDCKQLASKYSLKEQDIAVSELLALPGAVIDARGDTDQVDKQLEEAVLKAVSEALDCLVEMKTAEGKSMGEELQTQLAKLSEITGEIEKRAPLVIADYRQRLQKRLTTALADVGAELQESDLLREILLMTDKSDIREEIVRLRSHFKQFEDQLGASDSQGRKLDFLIQEMFRETNTIGSKAGDAEIAQRVVDIKSVIEQMREMVQNVE